MTINKFIFFSLRFVAGLTEAEIDWLASGDTGAVKTSRRDLPVVLGQVRILLLVTVNSQ